MNDTEKLDRKAKFMLIYANLPPAEQKKPILVLENNPLSWEVAYNELIHNTGRGRRILEKLAQLGII